MAVLEATARLRAYRPGICCRGVLQSRPSGLSRRCPAVRAGGASSPSLCPACWPSDITMHPSLSAAFVDLKLHASLCRCCKVGYPCQMCRLFSCCFSVCMRVQTGLHPQWQTQRRHSTKPSGNLCLACTTMSFRSSWFSSISCGTTRSTAMMRSAIPSLPVASWSSHHGTDQLLTVWVDGECKPDLIVLCPSISRTARKSLSTFSVIGRMGVCVHI